MAELQLPIATCTLSSVHRGSLVEPGHLCTKQCLIRLLTERLLVQAQPGAYSVFDLLSLSACVSVTGLLFDKLLLCEHLWRNWLARSAVNRKVAGSSPARCVLFLF